MFIPLAVSTATDAWAAACVFVVLAFWLLAPLSMVALFLIEPGPRWDVPIVVAFTGWSLTFLVLLLGPSASTPGFWTASGTWIIGGAGIGVSAFNAVHFAWRCRRCGTRRIRRLLEDGPTAAMNERAFGTCARCTNAEGPDATAALGDRGVPRSRGVDGGASGAGSSASHGR